MFIVTTAALAIVAGCGQSSPLEGPGAAMDTPVQSYRWDTGTRPGQELASAHYRIYTNSSNAMLVRYMPGFMEAAYRHYLELTGLEDAPGELMPIYLMNSRADWESLTRSVVGPQAGIYLSIQAGGYCYRGVSVFWDVGNLGTLTIASHEGLHQFFHHRLRLSLPVWLEEGLCTLAEGYRVEGDRVWFTPRTNLFRFRDLRVAIVEGHWMGLEDLLAGQPSQVLGGQADRAVGYYGQLWALLSFIRSEAAYREGMQRLLEDARQGRLTAGGGPPGPRRRQDAWLAMFRQYISADLEAFERAYRAYARSLAGLE